MAAPMIPQAQAVPGGLPPNLTAARVGQYQLRVRYYRRMKPQRVYPMIVELLPVDKKPATSSTPPGDPVTICPLVPGAHITPAVLEVGPKQSNSKATFYVTPLATGRLRDAKITVSHQGRVLQEVSLPATSATQTMTRFLAVLTFVLPAALYWLTVVQDLSETRGPIERKSSSTAKEAIKKETTKKETTKEDTKKEDKTKDTKKENPKKATSAITPDSDGYSFVYFQGPKGETPPPDDDDLSPKPEDEKKPTQPPPKGKIAKFLWENIPDYEGYTEEPKREAALTIQHGYDVARSMSREYLCFYFGATLLGMTLISWVFHRPVRGKRWGKPLNLPASEAPPTSGDSLSFNIPGAPLR
ncbi:MAG: hypothetical protein K2R98_03730 [Gemmataceae bacterium]|nr:hypothetical protein [Gemmataceae bacterium]